MRPTLTNRIAAHLMHNPERTFTNRDLSRILFAPMPSVRRATHDLRRRGLILHVDGGYANIPVSYQHYEPVEMAPASV